VIDEPPQELPVQPEELPVQPEVRVRSVRRRRSELPPPVSPPPVNVRNWMIYAGLSILVVALMVDGKLRHRPPRANLPSYSQATEVRSSVAEVADSLQVVVSWDLTLSGPAGRPDSMLITVTAEPRADSLHSFQSPNQLADTLYLAAPARGQTLRGQSCVAAEHPGQPLEASCTPWQYVRPNVVAQAPPTHPGSPTKIVVQPPGLQVDPDLEGKCAAWQQKHPTSSVWVAVNRKAVPECTGPNQKPTVAQFCAFLVLPDGRRLKAENSANSPYCDELFVEWSRERYS
jgi:hypothetical protein